MLDSSFAAIVPMLCVTLAAIASMVAESFRDKGEQMPIGGLGVIGLGFAWAANRWHLIPIPSDVYFISFLPFTLDVEDVVGVNVVAVVLSVVATWYPARIASRLDPITAIREE